MNYKVRYSVTANGQKIKSGRKIVLGERSLVDAETTAIREIERPYRDNPLLLLPYTANGKAELSVQLHSCREMPFLQGMLERLGIGGMPGSKPAGENRPASHPLIAALEELHAPEHVLVAAGCVVGLPSSAPDHMTKVRMVRLINAMVKKADETKEASQKAGQDQEDTSPVIESANKISRHFEAIKEKSLGTCRVNGRPGFILEHAPGSGYTVVFCLGGFNQDCQLHQLNYKDGVSSAPVSSWSLKSAEQPGASMAA
jgi:hypothetical protein